MNPKRLILAILVGFAFIFASDFLIHGKWLMADYQATSSLWRTQPEMQLRMKWMCLAQLLWAVTFVMLWARGFASTACITCACMFGLFMGLFRQVNTLVTYVVTPMPSELAIKWFAAGVIQSIALGLLTFFVYKPNASSCKTCSS